ncbi:hypothetical protein FC07_GL001401 [Loigolactobacillus bifermentans DSM 20003]|uniref:DUF2975 domain-containing protein n=1 Tax=Loigolactobacillus bifermentans DSM 20003 TaxID=1423726 RepID=A0A0R1GGJ5_9LACO|nr:hypothetical protein FC07_GL001401 [Loigolactobacillus bifermentans DSM 20003]
MLFYFILFCLYVSFLKPLTFLYTGFNGNVAQSIVTDRNYLLILNHTQLSAQAVQNFPSKTYSVFLAIGILFALIAATLLMRAGIQILRSLQRQQYFSLHNVHQLKHIVIAQLFGISADLFIATANQILRTNLYRINSQLTISWSDLPQDIILLIVLGLVYFIYDKAVLLQQENELTI